MSEQNPKAAEHQPSAGDVSGQKQPTALEPPGPGADEPEGVSGQQNPKAAAPTPRADGVLGQKQEQAVEPTRPRADLRLALLKYGATPGAWLVVALMAFYLVLQLLPTIEKRLTTIEVASFKLTLERVTASKGLGPQFAALHALSAEQLHLFLVIGGETGDDVIYHFPMPRQRAKRNYEALRDGGVLEIVEEGADGRMRFKTTQKGRDLHKILLDQLYLSIVIAE